LQQGVLEYIIYKCKEIVIWMLEKIVEWNCILWTNIAPGACEDLNLVLLTMQSKIG